MRRFFKDMLAVLILILFLSTASFAGSELKLSYNGTFYNSPPNNQSRINSPNGRYWCDYDISRVSDEVRELTNFRFYENNNLLYSLEIAPGSDLYISNSGITAFLDHSRHYRDELNIVFYSKEGNELYAHDFRGGFSFKFSPDGAKFGLCTTDNMNVISPIDGEVSEYPKGFQFSFSDDGELLAATQGVEVSFLSWAY